MKTDEEIKDFIDSREVLTRIELVEFIYGQKNKRHKTAFPKVQKYWLYVLQTKDMVKLRKYAEEKIRIGNHRKDAERIRTIIAEDERFNCGSKKASKLMNDIYNIRISRSIVNNYLKEKNVSAKIN